MNNKPDHKLIEDTINSMDGQLRAKPAPYLMSRISSRLATGTRPAGLLDRLIGFLTKPSIAFAVMALIVLLNFYVIRAKTTEAEDTTNIDMYLDGSAVAASSGINYDWNP